VDLIATGPGNNDWVHGIGTDTLGKDGDLTVQHDAVSGGKGDDFVGIVGTNFTSINGGGGSNTLVFEDSYMTLNLTEMGLRVRNFGTFDLSNQLSQNSLDNTDPRYSFNHFTVNNTLQLSLSDVLSENGAPSVASTYSNMKILGDSRSTVELNGTTDTSSLAAAGWSTTGPEKTLEISNGYTTVPVTFNVWHNSAMGASTLADLLIENGVNVI
ncbi:MAG: hypothetical protein LBU72_05010, partial [Burkholderiaceae bacterium]|nr:hypothetical protein [Burkholderiaceae bacterium]